MTLAFKALNLLFMITALPTKKDKTTPTTYAVLLKQIRQTINNGKDRAAQAVERELVRTKWDTGKLILEHILQHQDRAHYGEQVLKRLAADLAASQTELMYMLEFARANPIFPHAGKLSWDKQRDLLSVNEPKARIDLAAKAEKEKWTRGTLRREVKKLKAAKQITVRKAPKPEHLQAKRGVPGVYRIVDWKGQKACDLGFSTYYVIKGKLARVKEPAESELFTYEAEIDEVFDADTLWADIHLGFGIWTHQKLRLRGIDAPEITTTEGQAAKKFLASVIARRAKRGEAISRKVLITSTKSDKYDRYLADIWVGDVYVNQLLLDKGFATKVSE